MSSEARDKGYLLRLSRVKRTNAVLKDGKQLSTAVSTREKVAATPRESIILTTW